MAFPAARLDLRRSALTEQLAYAVRPVGVSESIDSGVSPFLTFSSPWKTRPYHPLTEAVGRCSPRLLAESSRADVRSDVVEGQFFQRCRLLGPRSMRASSRRAAHFILRSVTLRTRRQALMGCPDRLDFSLASMPSAVRCLPEGVQRPATCDRCLLLAKQLESCRTPLMGFVSKICLSVDIQRVCPLPTHDRPHPAGCPADWACDDFSLRCCRRLGFVVSLRPRLATPGLVPPMSFPTTTTAFSTHVV